MDPVPPLLSFGRLRLDGRGVGVMLVEVALDDPEIARVRPEEEIGNGSDPRDQAEQPIDADIARHARDLPFRHSKILRFPHDVGAEGSRGDIADHRNQVEDDIEADRPIDPGDDEESFQHPFHRFDALSNRGGVGPKVR